MSTGITVTESVSVRHKINRHLMWAEVDATLEPNPGGSVEVIIAIERLRHATGVGWDPVSVDHPYLVAFAEGIERQSTGVGDPPPRVHDVRVTLTEARQHDVDSSEMAFLIIATEWLQLAVDRAGPVVWVP